MLIPMAEFDAILADAMKVFTVWDDEHDKLNALMRDLSKKKRDEPMKMAWRIQPEHKKLQMRLEQTRGFRRAHEQVGSEERLAYSWIV